MALSRRPGDVALYRQIAELLQQRITDERLVPGDRLPSEPELSESLGVARATVAKALDLLVSEGLVIRRQGIGTFVERPPLTRSLPELTGFTEHVQALGLRSGHQLINSVTVEDPSDDPLLAHFGRQPVRVIERLRLIDDRPAGLHRVGLPAALARRIGLDDTALADKSLSVYERLDAHGVHLAGAEEHLRAVVADPHDAELLGIAPGAPVMLVRRLSRDTAGELVEAVDARYPGDLYDYRIDLIRPTPPTTEERHATDSLPGPDSGARLRDPGMRD